MIEVILMERIDRLGQMGQVVKVRPGFARNFLLPQKKALRATKANLELFDKQRAELEAKSAAMKAQAEIAAKEMDGLSLVVIRQASEMGMLYGSVTARDVADAAKEAGKTIDRQQVQIDTPIKTLGLFPVKLKLHPEVTLKVTVNVARSADEAVMQAQKGAAMLKADAAAAAAEEAEAKAAFEASAPEAPKAEEAAATDEAEAPAKKARKPRAKKAEADEA